MAFVTKMSRSVLRIGCVIAGAMAVATTAAAAEEPLKCYDRASLVAHLEAKFGETQQSVGYEEGRGVVELFANRGSGSWTVLLTPHETTSCVLRTGVAKIDTKPERGA